MRTRSTIHEQQYKRLSAMPPGRARSQAVERAVCEIENQIKTYEWFFHWPALIESLRQDCERLLTLK